MYLIPMDFHFQLTHKITEKDRTYYSFVLMAKSNLLFVEAKHDANHIVNMLATAYIFYDNFRN